MYKVLLLNSKGEIEDYRFCETYELAVRQCNEWQLQHENDFWETEIEGVSIQNTPRIWEEETFDDEDLPF